MIILSADFRSLAEYLQSNGNASLNPPDNCLRCAACAAFMRHGGYWRKVIEGEVVADVRVPRFRCKSCRLVISVLFAAGHTNFPVCRHPNTRSRPATKIFPSGLSAAKSSDGYSRSRIEAGGFFYRCKRNFHSWENPLVHRLPVQIPVVP